MLAKDGRFGPCFPFAGPSRLLMHPTQADQDTTRLRSRGHREHHGRHVRALEVAPSRIVNSTVVEANN